MVQPAWPTWPDLRDPEPYGAEPYREYQTSLPYGVDPYREYEVVSPVAPVVSSQPVRAAARVDLNAWRVPDRSQAVAERVLQGRVVTVLERSIPSRDPLVGEWWRVATPTGLEAYLAGTGPRGESYLDVLPSELPGLARVLSTLAVPREPVPGDPCLTGGGCLVHPPHVIDPNARTRIRRSSLRASTARIPRGDRVDVLSPAVNVTVTEREEDGEVFAYFTPDILGTHTFYRIRHCTPGTSLNCVEGWTERYNIVPGVVPGPPTAAEESTFWEDVGDFVTDPDTWAVIGTVATVGTYGWAAGILGSAQAIATQEAMKGLAGMFLDAGVCVAAGHPVSECTIGERGPNFVNGWKAQVAIRARLAAVALAGPAAASAKAALATQVPAQFVNAVTGIAQLAPLGTQWRDLDVRWEQQQKSDEQRRNEFLADSQRRFANDPDPMKRREDVQAIGINYHLRRNLFDTIHWDPVTGRRTGKRLGKAHFDPSRASSSSTQRNYTVEQLESLWRRAEERRLPQVLIDTFRARYERAKRIQNNTGIRFLGPSELIVLSLSPGGEPIDVSGTSPDGAARSRSFLRDALLASFLTSPIWVPFVLLPWLRKKRSRSRRRARR